MKVTGCSESSRSLLGPVAMDKWAHCLALMNVNCCCLCHCVPSVMPDRYTYIAHISGVLRAMELFCYHQGAGIFAQMVDLRVTVLRINSISMAVHSGDIHLR